MPNKEIARILTRLVQFEENPRPIGIQKLHDQEGYRIRTGNYRVLFEISDKEKKIFVYRIKHRKEVYR